MGKHTKGPWRAAEDFDGWEILAPADGMPGKVVIASEIGQGHDGGKADALLIAAAPDMLKALIDVSELPGFEKSEPYGIKVLKAIAKAKGGSNG